MKQTLLNTKLKLIIDHVLITFRLVYFDKKITNIDKLDNLYQNPEIF